MNIFNRFRKKPTSKDVQYDSFYRQKLREWGVRSPEDLSDTMKKKFYSQVKKEWIQMGRG